MPDSVSAIIAATSTTSVSSRVVMSSDNTPTTTPSVIRISIVKWFYFLKIWVERTPAFLPASRRFPSTS